MQRGGAEILVDCVAVHARRIGAGLGEFILALFVAFIDEDLVVDEAGDDDKLGARNVLGGEGGVFFGRRLRIAARRR